LAAGRVYDVSHVDAPVFDSEGNVTLILSLLPVPSAVTGATVTSLGQQMVAATARLTEALGGAPAAGAAGGRGS